MTVPSFILPLSAAALLLVASLFGGPPPADLDQRVLSTDERTKALDLVVNELWGSERLPKPGEQPVKPGRPTGLVGYDRIQYVGEVLYGKDDWSKINIQSDDALIKLFFKVLYGERDAMRRLHGALSAAKK